MPAPPAPLGAPVPPEPAADGAASWRAGAASGSARSSLAAVSTDDCEERRGGKGVSTDDCKVRRREGGKAVSTDDCAQVQVMAWG
eukprot:189933-Chlamydomonas_euryale.AAC.1